MALLQTIVAIILVMIAAAIVWRMFKKLLFSAVLFVALLIILYLLGLIAF